MQTRAAGLLQSYAARLCDLAAILEAEHQSLVEKNLEKLEDSTVKKQTLLQDIAKLEQERESLISNMDLEPEILKTDQSLIHLNSHIKTLLDKVKLQNEVNGAIIEVSRQFNQRLLGILLGNGDKNSLYDARGKNSLCPGNQSVARI